MLKKKISSVPLWLRAASQSLSLIWALPQWGTGFNLEIKSDTPFLSSSGASQDVTPHSQKPWMNTCTHKPPPLPPHSVSSSFPASPFFTLWGLLKGAWLHSQLGATQGSFPRGGWQEMKAVHIVPDAFQHYTYVGGRENYHSPVTRLILGCTHVRIYRIKLRKPHALKELWAQKWTVQTELLENKIKYNIYLNMYL